METSSLKSLPNMICSVSTMYLLLETNYTSIICARHLKLSSVESLNKLMKSVIFRSNPSTIPVPIAACIFFSFASSRVLYLWTSEAAPVVLAPCSCNCSSWCKSVNDDWNSVAKEVNASMVIKRS